jgi:hypothetical protein
LLGRKLGSRLSQRHELAVIPSGWKRDAILALGIARQVKGLGKVLKIAQPDVGRHAAARRP